MGPLSAISINWTGTPLTSEQIMIIQDAALDFEQHDSDARLMFEHPSCDGMIECKGRMMHGQYRGTRFLASLDSADGKKRTYEFLLTDFYTKSELRAAKCFWHVEPRKKKITELDPDTTRRTRTTVYKRSRVN